MRKALFVVLLTMSGVVRADDFSNNFTANLNQMALDELAKDLGSIVGGGSFHTGKALGFPLGFDVGVHVPVVGVSDDNAILKDDGSTTHALWGQVEAGLPAKLNLIARVGKIEDADLIGGGLRYGILSPSVPGLPAISISGLYSALDHDFFKAKTYSANLSVSFEIPVIHPYIGGGYDFTKVEPQAAAFATAPASVSRDLDATASGYRAEVGVNLSVIPFTYLTLAAGIANGNETYHAGAGVKF